MEQGYFEKYIALRALLKISQFRVGVLESEKDELKHKLNNARIEIKNLRTKQAHRII